MAGSDCPKPVQFCAARFARLNSDGTTPAGSSNGYIITTRQITATAKRVYDDGDEFTVKNGCGGLALATKAPRVLKWMELELEIVDQDPELLELLMDGSLITVGGNSVGYAEGTLGAAPGPGVSVELFRKAFVGNQQAATNPWLWTVMPKVVFSQDDDVFENGPSTLKLTGIAFENSSWGNGPWNDWPVGATTGRVSAFTRASAIPTEACGYSTVPAQV